MKVFISWSGDRSRHVARALRDWLPDLIQAVEPFMSQMDIDAGDRWSHEVAAELEAAKFGILVVTPENARAPWLNFEAGAIAKAVDGRVCPYLFGMGPAEIPGGPLTQFQSKRATPTETLEMVRALNGAMDTSCLPTERLERLFGQLWPTLESQLAITPQPDEPVPATPSAGEMMAEVLEAVRRIENVLSAQGRPAYWTLGSDGEMRPINTGFSNRSLWEWIQAPSDTPKMTPIKVVTRAE